MAPTSDIARQVEVVVDVAQGAAQNAAATAQVSIHPTDHCIS